VRATLPRPSISARTSSPAANPTWVTEPEKNAVAGAQPLAYGAEQPGHRAHPFAVVTARVAGLGYHTVHDRPRLGVEGRRDRRGLSERERPVEHVAGNDAFEAAGRAAQVHEIEPDGETGDRRRVGCNVDVATELDDHLGVGMQRRAEARVQHGSAHCS
jgi:hypothetical protein